MMPAKKVLYRTVKPRMGWRRTLRNPLTRNTAIAKPNRQRRRWRFGFAIAVFLVSGFLRVLLHPILGLTVLYSTFFAGIMLSAWYGGLYPGLVTTVLSGIAALVFLLRPLYP